MMMMFRKVRTVTPHTLSPLNMANTCHMAPLPTILALWHSWVHVCTTNCCDVATNVELTIDDFLGILSSLGIPNVNPNNGHVILGRHLDDMRLGSDNDIVEQVVVLKDAFNFTQRNMTVGFLANEGNTYNLEI